MSIYITPEEYEIAESNGIRARLVEQRVRTQSWDVKRAITTPVRKHKPKGTLTKWAEKAKKNGVSYDTFSARINVLGWDIEKAATKPKETKEERMERLNAGRRVFPLEFIKLAESNGIDYETFKYRVRSGKGYEEAATHPLMKNGRKKKTVNTPVKKTRPSGSLNKYAAMAKENGIAYQTMLHRINKMGWEPEKAATKPPETLEERRKRQTILAYNQKRKYPKEMVELAKKNGIGYQTFRLRVKAGKSYEEAATRPLRYESKI